MNTDNWRPPVSSTAGSGDTGGSHRSVTVVTPELAGDDRCGHPQQQALGLGGISLSGGVAMAWGGSLSDTDNVALLYLQGLKSLLALSLWSHIAQPGMKASSKLCRRLFCTGRSYAKANFGEPNSSKGDRHLPPRQPQDMYSEHISAPNSRGFHWS